MKKTREEKKAKVASLIIYIGLFRDIFGRKSLFDARGLFGEMFFQKTTVTTYKELQGISKVRSDFLFA